MLTPPLGTWKPESERHIGEKEEDKKKKKKG